ncbi:Dyp-type peroxidase [Gordonia pseudamarae]|uniref:Dyp-type peroxidase n=1 Tax=Gordonia pseudamarae TaxID=2831662 RepID=A0ABX6IFC7_9ACTN|nr:MULTISPECIES: Dyp-type peroxidase [Gordonia]MBD0020536.1 Dyp-type peroxidase [Gordonia sp. (in: high G+C Gram-positive bacteria)]QHN25629.1 Dyp-type peroxidase [Gordonia pseudamarae]QHN34562.1 Dyp-type peroxidase [Gordonia pseudamarae]
MPVSSGIGRRRFLAGAAGLAGLGVGAGVTAGGAAALRPAPTECTFGSETVDFHGDHQAGVTTTPPAHVTYVGVDLVPGANASVLGGILGIWTDDAARLTQGRPSLSDAEPELARLPARLTVTVGIGERVFTVADKEKLRPTWLRPLPAFGIDKLDPKWGQTDLLVAICSDDPMTVAHTVRVMVNAVRTRIRVRWVQRGFRESRGAQADGATMRNLMGQVDGTVQPDSSLHDSLIWDDGSAQPWFAGGTSLVLRRIAMDLDGWAELDRRGRELTVGRRLSDGAPLSGTSERDDPDFTAIKNGLPVIPASAHVARARRTGDRDRFLRRAYNYDDPPNGAAISDSGLLFAAFQRDIDAQFVPVQRRLAEHDALNEWTVPIGSAVYAILPGVREGEVLGSALHERP